MRKNWMLAAVIGAVYFALFVTGCSGKSFPTEDCDQEVRFGGAVYTGYHATDAEAAEKHGTAERADCDDQSSSEQGSDSRAEPVQVTVWSFSNHSPDDVLLVRSDTSSFVAFLARSLTPSERDAILRDLRTHGRER